MDLGLKGHRVIVTAGANGIGLAVARAFAAEGARVQVCDVDQAALDALAESDPAIPGTHCDVSNRAAVTAFFEEALEDLGGLDCLVNNAGIAGPTAPVEAIEPEDWDQTLAVCLTSQFNCTRLAVEPLKASGNPSIINLSSAAGRFGFRNRTPYAAAKWGVIGFSRSLSRELGPFGIRVNAILPGIVAGERQDRVIAAKARSLNKSFDEVEAEIMSQCSIPQMVTAQELADMMLFLASTRGKTISGQAIGIDGDLQGLV
ncbi:SDR family oxidoreductase [Marimonas lutisalis]|uniref:SDR family oxidoreductase n=1 Tax=Marimonas lutisalis TaxID=2545756 RepID=UPI0010F803E1|nr:SDR family oxidoreductase [Marimonas lutisalis]